MTARTVALATLALAVAPAGAQEIGQFFRDCTVCPEMVVVPSGRFIMGSPETEEGRGDDEGPRRVVSIDSFAVGVYEITFEEWDACAWEGGCGGAIPEDEGWGRANRPVVNVSWEDAESYVGWLSGATGQQYRLLTEAEWEYVARAGTQTARYWGDSASEQCTYANGDDDDVSCTDGFANTAPAGALHPNAFGLYDMLGNVWEWVEDCWHDSYSNAPNDGSAMRSESECSYRVLRGGSGANDPAKIRSAHRGNWYPTIGERYYGFRVARNVR